MNNDTCIGTTEVPRQFSLSQCQLDWLDSFTYHQPTEEQIERISRVRTTLRTAASVMFEVVPDGPDQIVVVRLLHEAMMNANKAIVCEKP